ncbi:MAG: GAF domain-containing protein [Synergistaceae bacterium]|jgi:GAF domain-containing protein|nr:GAF domain-containing protein [Synergistaceae bacterium]
MEIDVGQYASKKEMYDHINASLTQMLRGNGDSVAGLANASALLKLFLEDINWVGFYLVKNGLLTLGPFQGKPAVMQIRPGEGVCGTAVEEGKTRRVDDVHTCTNHIACDLASSSEIVVPLIKNGETLGVLDIDSPVPARFDEEDERGLESLAATLTSLVFN